MPSPATIRFKAWSAKQLAKGCCRLCNRKRAVNSKVHCSRHMIAARMATRRRLGIPRSRWWKRGRPRLKPAA